MADRQAIPLAGLRGLKQAQLRQRSQRHSDHNERGPADRRQRRNYGGRLSERQPVLGSQRPRLSLLDMRKRGHPCLGANSCRI